MRILPLVLCLMLPASLRAVDYAKEILPLWEEHCVDCHAGDDGDGGFALDTHAALMKGGESGAALLPGKAEESLLVKFLLGTSGKTGKNQFMPPGKRQHLSEAQITLVKQWINEGAKAGPAVVPVGDPLAKLPAVKAESSIQPIHSVAASRQGTVLALGRYGKVQLMDAQKRTMLRELSGLAGKASELAFSADGALLYVAAGEAGVSGKAYVYSTKDGAMLQSISAGSDALYAMALAPDEKLLATAGYDQKISLWELPSGKLLRVLKGHNGSVNAVAFRPDGKVLASASADRTVKLWEVATGARLDTFSQPTKEQTTLTFSRDGKLLYAGGADNRIRVWNVSEKAVEGSNSILTTSFAAEGSVLRLALSPDGKTLLSSAADRSLKVWEADPLQERLLMEKQSDWANALAWYAAGRFLVGRQDGSMALYAADKAASDGGVASAGEAASVMKKPAQKPAKAAAAAKPELLRAWPAGVVTGQAVTVQVEGKALSGVTAVSVSDARLKAVLKKSVSPTQLELELTAAKDLPRGSYSLTVTTAAGTSAALKLYADDLPQLTVVPKEPLSAAVNAWGVLKDIGQRDDYRFTAKKGHTVVLDAAVRSIASKAATPQLEVFSSKGARLAFSRGLDSGTDPFIAFTAPEDGTYTARMSETTLDGSADHIYRLTLGAVPFIVGWWPLTLPPDSEAELRLVGYNLPAQTVKLKTAATGAVTLPAELASLRRRSVMPPTVGTANEVLETEPNDGLAQAQKLTLPASVNGLLHGQETDADLYSFQAKAGERWIMETTAAQLSSPVDTKLEVLHADTGKPVEQLRLRAMRDSWNNFRSVDANNPDIRLEYWREMDLNDYVYLSGDVMRIFRNPRGPDAGFLFYNINGKRVAYFGTTAAGHALEEPAYIVQPLKAGEEPVPNGLPVFSIPYANDDEGTRALGRDSRIDFTAPATGRYVVRVTDSRGWVGERFAYRLQLRAAQPDFSVALEGGNAAVNAGSSKGFSLRATRVDAYEGAITVRVQSLPKGWHASSPVVIEPGQLLATGSLTAEAGAEMDFSRLKILASAEVAGKPVSKEVQGFGKPTLAAKAKFVPQLEPSVAGKPVARSGAEPAVITLVAGESVPAFIRVERQGEEGLLNFDVHNLPFGVIVDNIGLNGVQVRAKETVREITLSAAKWVPEQERLIHAAVASARSEQASDGLATSYPVLLRVVKKSAVVMK